MPITPTSTKSKQYQALGIDEIANDIETVFNSVNTLETDLGLLQTEVDNLPAAPTTEVVNISAAQILNFDQINGAVTLLPVPAAGKYYDIHNIRLEYTHNTTAYTTDGTNLYVSYSDMQQDFSITPLTDVYDAVWIVDFNSLTPNTIGGDVILPIYPNYTAVKIGISGFGFSITNGDGTLKAIITYTLRTFGA